MFKFIERGLLLSLIVFVFEGDRTRNLFIVFLREKLDSLWIIINQVF